MFNEDLKSRKRTWTVGSWIELIRDIRDDKAADQEPSDNPQGRRFRNPFQPRNSPRIDLHQIKNSSIMNFLLRLFHEYSNPDPSCHSEEKVTLKFIHARIPETPFTPPPPPPLTTMYRSLLRFSSGKMTAKCEEGFSEQEEKAPKRKRGNGGLPFKNLKKLQRSVADNWTGEAFQYDPAYPNTPVVSGKTTRKAVWRAAFSH